MGIKRSLMVLSVIMLVSLVSASDSIGQRQDAQIDKVYYISQPCATCTYINISVFTKEGLILNNVPMTNNGSTWIYAFTPNESLRYDVNGIGDKDGMNDSFAFWFDATLSGQQNNTTIIISDILLLLMVLGIIMLVSNKHEKTDFKAWDKKIVDTHKNMGQTMVKGFIYSLFKNTFFWFYFLGWVLILILKDVIYRFNSVEIYGYFTLIANIYSLGLILVLVFMIGTFYSYLKEMVGVLTDNNWGVGK